MRRAGVWLWVLAFLFTAATAVHQRLTGPTHPVRGRVTVGQTELRFRLPRSQDTGADARIRIPAGDPAFRGTVAFRRYRSNDPWTEAALEREGDTLVARLPEQPAAGKVMYRVTMRGADGTPVALTAEPVVLRFKGPVPAAVLIAHVVTIFAGMMWSVRTGLEALRKQPRTFNLAVWTVGLLAIGGLILGPVVQKYAFGALWTGWPLGHDLTDNKLAVAVVVWLLALWRNWKGRPARGWVLAAALVTLAAWLIPHSLLGSELDYTQMEAPAAKA